MTKRDDGGPAFPNEGGDLSGLHPHPGMSLRDWFAGQALAEAVNDYQRMDRGNPVLPYATKTVGTREQIIAWQAYRYADAMIAAKGKKS